ncbi:hypothetical protein FD724_23220 [Nostoc sp. C057]|uniref:hypothetical protein n=1 Tax=Nostoc sp. C057 TaxID=2576903 RepID=UPI0015C3DCCD|nr:hypothetical protein [Nostoc sp. C057]QLE50718.1 hypothetical protein FD724_23220 [Nostoc sp. C057]
MFAKFKLNCDRSMYQLLQILTYSQAQQNGLVCPKRMDTFWQVDYTEKFSDEKIKKNMTQ